MRTKSSKHSFNNEVEMYEPLLHLFTKKILTIAEVPFYGKHIDLVFASNTLTSLYAVETKLQNWRVAFKQAALNQVAVQRSYVALPSILAHKILEQNKDLFVMHNVGLIAVNKKASVILPATRNGCFSIMHYRVLKDKIRNLKSNKSNKIGVVADAISKRTKTMVVLQTRAN